MEKKRLYPWIAVYCILFYAAWAVFQIVLSPMLSQAVTNPYLETFLTDGLIKSLLWAVPAVLLLRRFRDFAVVKPEKLFPLRIPWADYVLLFLLLFIVPLFRGITQRGGFSLSPSFQGADLITVVFVGLTEELAFRGWLLNVTAKDDQSWVAIGVNAVMFLGIHFPIWIRDGLLVTNFVNLGFVGILILGGLFGWIFLRSKSLLLPVLLHSVYDLSCFLFLS